MIQEPHVEHPAPAELPSFENKPGQVWTAAELEECHRWLAGRLPEIQKHVAQVFDKWPELPAEDAADALSSFFVRRLDGILRSYDPGKGTLIGFVLFCLTRHCNAMAGKSHERSRLERSRLNPAGQDLVLLLEDTSAVSDPLGRLQRRETRLLVHRAVGSLREEYREVIRLQLQGRTCEEIALELRISVPNVKTRLHRARHELRASLAALDSSGKVGLP
jgi:RNA polymerase sigma factor (sigma-70 family)